MTVRPTPVIDAVSEPFWQSAASGQLSIAYCPSCERFIHPPRSQCAECGGEFEWRAVSGRGRVYSRTVPRRVWLEGFDRPAPYGFFVVELEEQAGLLLPSDCSYEVIQHIRVGDEVEVTFEDHPGFTLPQFRPSADVESPEVRA